MTTADVGALARDGLRPAPLRRLATVVSADRLAWAALALLWILGHSFVGIEYDARIYMGRALADLDPGGVGRDMMFALDGQGAFTIFRLASKALVGSLGLGPAVGLLTIVNLAVWFIAIVWLVRALVPGRAALLVLLVALALPRSYGPWQVFAAGESIPIPRPLAEAAVLLALAAFLQNRKGLGSVFLITATVVHPIMAAPGFAVLFVLLVREDRRWLIAAGAAVGLLAGGAALGAPVLSRLLVVVDPEWRVVLVERSPYLLLRLWPAEAYGAILVQATTIVTASLLIDKRVRFLLLCTLSVAGIGALASLVLAEGASSLLALQAQLWRALWLPAALAPVAAGICVWRLPGRGDAGRIALALLAVAWIGMKEMPVGPVAALSALGFAWFGPHRLVLGHRAVGAVAIVCGLLVVCLQAVPISALVESARMRPAGTHLPWILVWDTGAMVLPTICLALAWWHAGRGTALRVGAGLTVAALAGLAAINWDDRTPFKAFSDSGEPQVALQAMLASRPGEVLWLAGDEGWVWLKAPNWTGRSQGASIVFSRALAMKWHDRSLAAVHHGLFTAKLLTPWRDDLSSEAADLARADLLGFCRRPDAPAWIVAPLEAERPTPDIPGIEIWRPHLVKRSFVAGRDTFRWVSIDRFGVIPCGRKADAA